MFYNSIFKFLSEKARIVDLATEIESDDSSSFNCFYRGNTVRVPMAGMAWD